MCAPASTVSRGRDRRLDRGFGGVARAREAHGPAQPLPERGDLALGPVGRRRGLGEPRQAVHQGSLQARGGSHREFRTRVARQRQQRHLIAPRRRDHLDRVQADRDQQIGVLESVELGARAGEVADHPGMAVGQHALGLVAGQHRTAQGLGELAQRRGDTLGPGLGAGQDRRAAARREQLSDHHQIAGHTLPNGGARRPGRPRRARGHGRTRGLGGEIDVHRPLGLVERKIEQFRQDPRAVLGPQALGGLDDRREQGRLIEGLVRRHPSLCVRLPRIGDDDQRRALERGVGDAVDRARGTRTDAGEYDPGRAGQLGGHRGHHGGRGLAAGEHEVDPLPAGCGDQIEAGIAAGHAEDAAHTARLEGGQHGVGECHGTRVMGPESWRVSARGASLIPRIRFG